MRLIASGRAADVFDVGDGRVLRRYRTPVGLLPEAAVMQHVRAHGYPVPEVHEVAGSEMLMDRVDGPTMIEDLQRRPWRLRRHARSLASLHHQLHRIPHADGGVVLHLDLHPLNVILSPSGPVVIDWANARGGEGYDDVAMTWIIMATSVVEGPLPLRVLALLFRRLFVRLFLRSFERRELERRLPAIAEQRLADRNVRDAERSRIHAMLKSVG